MTVRRAYVIRHAQAESRRLFEGDDADRPLTSAGGRTAKLLAATLSSPGPAPERVWSSPAKRCTDTVAPLAEELGIEVETVPWLAEGSAVPHAIEEMRLAEADVVAASTHGDLVWGVLEWLARGGVELGARPDSPKGSTWILDWPDDSAEGVPVRASFLPAPR